MVTRVGETPPPEHALIKKIDSVGWGLVFLWIGVALLADFGWGVGLVGVGVITLAGQAWRHHVQARVEGFWVTIGALEVICGVWNVFALRVDVVPILFIVAGVALLASAGRRRSERRGDLHGHAQPRP